MSLGVFFGSDLRLEVQSIEKATRENVATSWTLINAARSDVAQTRTAIQKVRAAMAGARFASLPPVA